MCREDLVSRNGGLPRRTGWIWKIRKELEITVLPQVTKSTLTWWEATRGLKGSQ